MRLTEDQLRIIKQAVIRNFGDDSKVYLFGSRVDDSKKGGDIDLLIVADFSPEDQFHRKISLLTDLQFKLGERKIDIITFSRLTAGDAIPLIVEEALSNGVEL
jgi:predicted nucleotidyltransferase